MTLDPSRCRALACAVVEQSLLMLNTKRRQKEIDWFLDPKRSEVWIVGTGMDYDAVISRLQRDGQLTPLPPAAIRPSVPRAPISHVAMQRRVLAKLPLYPETACPARAIADSVGVYVAVVRAALNALKADGKAESQRVPLRGGMTEIWWRKS